MGFYGCIPRFLKNHANLILTILSGVGLTGTMIATAKAAPKAEQTLQDELNNKIRIRTNEIIDKEGEDREDDEYWWETFEIVSGETKLTLGDKIKIAGPIYAPAILLWLGTMACLTGNHILNGRRQAALLSAYLLLQQDFGAYRHEIRETYGAEADRKALEESRKKIRMLEEDVKRLEAIKGIQIYGIATLPGVVFKSDMANIDRAFLHFNRNLILGEGRTMEELYSFIGLPEETWKYIRKAPDEDYGWNAYINEVEFGCAFLDYRLEKIEAYDGTDAYMIDFDIPPYRLGAYDQEVLDSGEWYDGYNPEEARRLMKSGLEKVPVLIDSVSNSVWTPPMF